MRFVYVITMFLMFSIPQTGQAVETLFDGPVDHGGFGGPALKFTQINDELGVLIGGRGGWIINHSFMIGGGVYGLANDIEPPITQPDHFYRYDRIDMGYGGLEMEYFFRPSKLVHGSAILLIGGGGVDYGFSHQDDWEWDKSDEDGFFVLEPGMNATLNMTKRFRISAGLSYRLVDGVDLVGLDDGDLSGLSGVLTLKFGTF